MSDYVPCGACHAYVPVTGCPHWRPTIAENAGDDEGREARKAADDRARANAVEAVASFRRLMRLGSS